MRSLEDIDIATSNGLDARPGAILAAHDPRQPRDPWLRIGPEAVMTLPPGQPGHGKTASLRRQPVRIVQGRMEGGYTDAFELVCPSCGDHPYLDYSDLPPQLQQLREPHTLQAGLAAYDEHLALLPQPYETASVTGGYQHEALLYSGLVGFLTGTTSFIRKAIRAGDPILVMISGSKISVLDQALGAKARHVTFADMAGLGGNPGRIIAAWWAFRQAHAGAAQVWGIGEPIYPGRSPAELAECQLHEALLNIAFDASTPFRLLCPYDLEALTGDVIDEGHRTHPFVVCSGQRQASRTFRPIDLANPFARPLPIRPTNAAYLAFRRDGLGRVRDVRR